MGQNYKNTIQEYCQKNKLSLPQYDTKLIESKSNEPQWKSTIIFKDIAITGHIKKTKILSEQSAAYELCDILSFDNTKHIKY